MHKTTKKEWWQSKKKRSNYEVFAFPLSLSHYMWRLHYFKEIYYFQRLIYTIFMCENFLMDEISLNNSFMKRSLRSIFESLKIAWNIDGRILLQINLRHLNNCLKCWHCAQPEIESFSNINEKSLIIALNVDSHRARNFRKKLFILSFLVLNNWNTTDS